MVIYSGDKFPGGRVSSSWARSPALGVWRVGLNEKGLAGRELLLGSLRQRIRDVRQGPDGFLYLVVDANPGGILRVEPAPAAAGSGQ